MSSYRFIGQHDLERTARAIIEAPLDVTESDSDRLKAIDKAIKEAERARA